MSLDIKVPVLPESVSDAVIAKWHKQAGERVSRDENLVDIETDKVVLEVVAPEDGALEEILQIEGSTVTTEQVIAKFATGAKKESSEAIEKAPITPSPESPINQEPAKPEKPEKPEKIEQEQTITPAASVASNADAHATPSARRAMSEQGIQQQAVNGSGKDGKILKEDIDNFKPVAATSVASDARSKERVPMTRLRLRIAERLLSAQQNAAILTTFNEINMQPIMALRKKYQDEFEKKYGVRLGFMSFFVAATVAALKRFPAINASIDGNDIVYHGYFDVGVAVSSPRGLVVPIIRNVDTMSLAEIEKNIRDYGQRAQDGQISIEEMTGGTFTISNGGVFGSLMSTPIINPPQSGILGMHKIEERAVVIEGKIEIRPMMYVALSYDHRIVDGAESVQFLVTIKNMLEDPARLIIGV